ncbi:uncharacterized protein LOC125264448 [Megalobrama amblycephala]|uniref:uncharacterized protein LOC125264448 n=1 Tax=Megalobrama amblycephala TaxID=75352 RepID=UPI0020143F5B|nr:uncharacterized protein LOC125264448 [Megalobrama amblycephala]
MFVLGLLTCIALRAFSAQAKVVETFDECSEFFYKHTEPEGMDQNAKRICQKLENRGFYYATLYFIPYKIPLYSAYILDPSCSSDTSRSDDWHLEPQISKPEAQIDHMVRENQRSREDYFENQAISSDYSLTGYDRGHLNPNSFSCGEGRTATFTLTNAAPMAQRFNQVHWRRWEGTLRSYLIQKLISDSGLATAFIVTGTVPDRNTWLPRTPGERVRVNVPSHIWTAVCYKHNFDDRKSFSFGFIGRNHPTEPDIRLMSVSYLNNELSWRYGSLSAINIFDDDCFGDNNKLQEVQVKFQKLINLPVNNAVKTCLVIQNTNLLENRADCSDIISESNNNQVASHSTVKLTFDSMSSYYRVTEELKVFAGSVCLLTHAKTQVRIMHDELRKREVSAGSDAVQCQLVPEKQIAADGSPCSSISDSGYGCHCDTGGETKRCCSSPCLYQDDLKGYRCYSGQELIACSPPYSLITYEGDRCKDDHPCGTYGEDYYWCYKISGSWDYCSPPLWRSKAKNGQYCPNNNACAKYGESYRWCYTDYEGNYDYCCTSDDCYSTVSDQTCKPSHPCGKHGKDYLWCWTTDGSWDYCCTSCG